MPRSNMLGTDKLNNENLRLTKERKMYLVFLRQGYCVTPLEGKCRYTVKKPKGLGLCPRNLAIPASKCIFRTVEK
jgi:hypothetical protein